MKKIILILALMAVLFKACTMRSGNIPHDTIIWWEVAYNVPPENSAKHLGGKCVGTP